MTESAVPPRAAADESSRRDIVVGVAVLAAALVVLLPVVRPTWFVFDPAIQVALRPAGACLAAVICLSIATTVYRWWTPFPPAERRGLLLAASLLSVWCVDLHYSNVDLGDYFGDLYADNVDWQRRLQAGVLQLDPATIPHCYRFLPNCVVAWLQLLTGNYLVAALLYRLTIQFTLLIAIYRLARLWNGRGGALIALLFYSLAYVASLRYYAGQLTDPLSHLSFVLGYWFLKAERPWAFLPVIVLGVLAKESVLLLSMFALLTHWRTPRVGVAWGVSLVTAVIVLWGVRIAVAGNPAYEKISGVTPAHVHDNFLDVWHWGRQTWETVGALWVVAAISWRSQPLLLRQLALFLFPTLWLSSLLFSHLKEARNLIPLSVIVAVMAARVVWRFGDSNEGPAGEPRISGSAVGSP
jgi:hypothetical protein